MLVEDLIEALRGLPLDATIEAWNPGDGCDFAVTAVTYSEHGRRVSLLGHTGEVSVAERIVYEEPAVSPKEKAATGEFFRSVGDDARHILIAALPNEPVIVDSATADYEITGSEKP